MVGEWWVVGGWRVMRRWRVVNGVARDDGWVGRVEGVCVVGSGCVEGGGWVVGGGWVEGGARVKGNEWVARAGTAVAARSGVTVLGTVSAMRASSVDSPSTLSSKEASPSIIKLAAAATSAKLPKEAFPALSIDEGGTEGSTGPGRRGRRAGHVLEACAAFVFGEIVIFVVLKF